MTATIEPSGDGRRDGPPTARRPRVAFTPLDGDAVATRALVRDLGAGGVDVDVVPRVGADLAAPDGIDVALVDVDPRSDDGWAGVEAVRREAPDVPLLVRMLRDDVAATLRGFDLGAEDVLPYRTVSAEVRARIAVVLRRRRRDSVIGYGDLTIDFTARVAFLGAEALPLSGLEFDVLAWLAGHPHRVWARRDLVERAWPAWQDPPERSVDVRIRNLRVALGDDVGCPTFIETVRGRGYRWVRPPDDVPPGFTDR